MYILVDFWTLDGTTGTPAYAFATLCVIPEVANPPAGFGSIYVAPASMLASSTR